MNKLTPIEVYNDINSDVVNFFRCLREKQQELIEQLILTPFSREECKNAIIQDNSISDIEKARRFFVKVKQLRSGCLNLDGSSWRFTRDTVRAGIAKTIRDWKKSIKEIEYVSNRFLLIQIENDIAIKIIERYDTPDTLFYLDPPYVKETRIDKDSYPFEMTDDDHAILYSSLKRIKGKACISGYDSKLYQDLYKDWNCYKKQFKSMASDKKSIREECLWTNYEANRQMDMFQEIEKDFNKRTGGVPE